MVTIEDFMKLELVVARVKEATAHPDADKLLVLKVDAGGEERQLVAGIRKAYVPETLVGRDVVIIKNLQPVVLRGVESQGMVLAAAGEDGPVLLAPDRDVPAGSRVK
jgi:methionyl-tRNA synthetase